MERTKVLDPDSLARTVWNLQIDEPGDPGSVRQALEWVVARYALPGSYAGALFAPTETDIRERLGAPTGDTRGLGAGGVAHVLGEEAVRALLGRGCRTGWDSETALETIASGFRRGPGDAAESRPGCFCCMKCSVARWRAVASGRPRGWEEILGGGVRFLAGRPRSDDGAWRGLPFYYTLLALSEMGTPEARREADTVRPTAERRFRMMRADGPHAVFRRRALEWALA